MDFCASVVNPFRIGSGAVNTFDTLISDKSNDGLLADVSDELLDTCDDCLDSGLLFIDTPTTILSDKMIERIYRSFEHFIKQIYSSEWYHYTMSFKKD